MHLVRKGLFVARYMEWDAPHSKTCGGEWHTYCPPEEFPATPNILYHNNGDGALTDVSQKSGIAARKAGPWEWLSPTTLMTASLIYSSPTTMENQEYGAAIAPLKHALELSPDLAAAHQLLGYVLLAQGYNAERETQEFQKLQGPATQSERTQ